MRIKNDRLRDPRLPEVVKKKQRFDKTLPCTSGGFLKNINHFEAKKRQTNSIENRPPTINKADLKAYSSQRFIPQIIRKLQRGGRNTKGLPNVGNWTLSKKQSVDKAMRLQSMLNSTSDQSDDKPYQPSGYSTFQTQHRCGHLQQSDVFPQSDELNSLPIQMRSLYAKKSSELLSKRAEKSQSHWRQTNPKCGQMRADQTRWQLESRTGVQQHSEGRNDAASFRPYNL